MKKLAEVVEVENEGLVALLGKRVEVWCANYTYEGVLEGVNTDDILLNECRLVYDTGKIDSTGYATVTKFGQPKRYVRTAFIESYAEVQE
jgi:hypothetical protein